MSNKLMRNLCKISETNWNLLVKFGLHWYLNWIEFLSSFEFNNFLLNFVSHSDFCPVFITLINLSDFIHEPWAEFPLSRKAEVKLKIAIVKCGNQIKKNSRNFSTPINHALHHRLIRLHRNLTRLLDKIVAYPCTNVCLNLIKFKWN